jgi:hypothetical protein
LIGATKASAAKSLCCLHALLLRAARRRACKGGGEIMNGEEFRKAIRIRIGEQIEILAKEICERGNPIHAQWLLQALSRRLEDEENISSRPSACQNRDAA